MVSTSAVGIPLQSLVGLAPAWIVPVQFSVRVWPVLVGTVTDWLDGVAASACDVGSPRAASVRTAGVATERRIGRSSADGGSPRVERTVDLPVPLRTSNQRLVNLPGWLVTLPRR